MTAGTDRPAGGGDGGRDGKVILAVDHGTSGVKVSLVTAGGRVLGTEMRPVATRFLPGGGAEQDPGEWWDALVGAARALLARGLCPPDEIAAAGVSSTFSSTVAVDRAGDHLAPSLTWMDSRGAPYVRRIMGGFPRVAGYGALNLLRWIPKTAGGPTLSGKDDIAHALWIKHELPAVYEKTFMFLPSKDYLNLRLTGEFAASFDSMTLFWVTDTRDTRDVRYDDGLARRLGIARDKLPPLVPSTRVIGTICDRAARALGLPRGVRVVAGSPDHQSACIGSGAVRDFEGHLYVGTSSWVQCIVPFKKTDPFHSIASLPTAIPGRWYCANEQDMAGGCLQLLARTILPPGGPEEDPYARMDGLAARAPAGSGGLVFAPWLNGERTPVDDPGLRGSLLGLSTTTTLPDMVRAVYEGVACNVRWSLRHVERFVGRRLDPLAIVGGGARSAVWCRIFADVLGRTVRQVEDPQQANARGAALIAAVGLGLTTFEEIPGLVPVREVFAPDPAARAVYDRLFDEFLAVYRAARALSRRRRTDCRAS